MQDKMKALLQEPITETEQQQNYALLAREYDWNHIADQTIEVYSKVLKG